ncbi:MAG: pyrimidine/purine nucleoside phosphorylase [Fuerstiella sp.]
MSKFESVNVLKAANIYFDGRVSSRTIEFADGSTKTLGLMLPGEYTFNTAKPELMEITSGKVSWCLAGESDWHTVGGGESFDVPGDSSFQIRVEEVTDYICSFLPN